MQNKPWYKGNICSVTFLRLMVILVLFTVSRILFYVFNTSYFSDLAFTEFLKIIFYGIRFDISAILIVNLPFIFFNIIPFKFRYNKIYQIINNWIFYILNSIALASNYIDVIYFRFILKRSTGDIFAFISNEENEIVSLIPQFIKDFWYVFLIWIFSIFLIVFLVNKFKPKLRKIKISNPAYYISRTMIFIIIAFFTVIGIRGGFQLKPIRIITAGQYTNSKNIPIILNTPFAIIKTINQHGLEPVNYFSNNDELNKIFNPVFKNKIIRTDTSASTFKDFNLVIFIMESYTTEHIGALNPFLENGNYKGYTPFLDSLINKSLVFKSYANGKRSIEGIPAILASLPTLMNFDYITSIYSGNKINSIAGLLKEKGYSSAFYHGGTNGTMSFDAFVKIAGFEKYYGRTEYNNENDYDGKWGIFDEEFFQFAAENINHTQQPFFATIFSLSSHHPYSIPEKYKNKFRKGNLEIHKSIMYADYSLKQFFKTASAMPWFENTLFVITADHTSETYYPQYQTNAGNYAIPIIFYKSGSNLTGIQTYVAQQTDIMPTILNYLNFDKNFIAFGTNLLDTTSYHFSISYLNGIYQLIKDNYVLQFDGNKSTALYNLKTDSLLHYNLISSEDTIKTELENFIKAIIQQYNSRLINNELIILN